MFSKKKINKHANRKSCENHAPHLARLNGHLASEKVILFAKQAALDEQASWLSEGMKRLTCAVGLIGGEDAITDSVAKPIACELWKGSAVSDGLVKQRS